MSDLTHSPCVLVTGFGAFPGVSNNPSGAAAKALDGVKLGELTCVGRVLDVSYLRSFEQIKAACTETSPAAIMLLGVARRASCLQLERQAQNFASSTLMDVDGVLGSGALNPELGTDVSLTTEFDVDSALSWLNEAGHQGVCSKDAGGYVCNSLYFKVLDWATVPVVFVHVPPLEVWTSDRLGEALRYLLCRWVAEL